MTSTEAELRSTLLLLSDTITLLFKELKQAVEETDPEAEAYVLMEKMAIIFEKHTGKIVGAVIDPDLKKE